MLVHIGMQRPIAGFVAAPPRRSLGAQMVSPEKPGRVGLTLHVTRTGTVNRRNRNRPAAAALAQLHEQSGHLRPVSSTRSPRISATRMNTETLARQDSLLRPTCPQVNRVSGAFTAILRLLPSVMTGTSSTVVGQRPGTRPPPVPGLIHHGCHPG